MYLSIYPYIKYLHKFANNSFLYIPLYMRHAVKFMQIFGPKKIVKILSSFKQGDKEILNLILFKKYFFINLINFF